MSHSADLRHFANWYRSLGKSTRRNGLDDFADEMVALRKDLEAARLDQSVLLERAAHEAWLRSKAGGTPEEIAAAVTRLKPSTGL